MADPFLVALVLFSALSSERELGRPTLHQFSDRGESDRTEKRKENVQQKDPSKTNYL